VAREVDCPDFGFCGNAGSKRAAHNKGAKSSKEMKCRFVIVAP